MPRGGAGGRCASVSEPPAGGRRGWPRLPPGCQAITAPAASGGLKHRRACAKSSGTSPAGGWIGTPRGPVARPRRLAGCAARAILSARRHFALPLHIRPKTSAGAALMRPVPPPGTCGGNPARLPTCRTVHTCRPAARCLGAALAADLRRQASGRPPSMMHPGRSLRTAARARGSPGGEAP